MEAFTIFTMLLRVRGADPRAQANSSCIRSEKAGEQAGCGDVMLEKRSRRCHETETSFSGRGGRRGISKVALISPLGKADCPA